jgi:hypothetical protein
MTTVTIKGIVHEVDWGHGMDKEYCMFRTDMSDRWYTAIAEVEFQYELPADFNPVASKLAAIDAAKAAALAEYQAKVSELNEMASKLQALPNYAETA